MLRRFFYLDEAALADYISALEDGLRQRRTSTEGSASGGGGKVNIKVAEGHGERQRDESRSIESSDTPAAQFDRLLRLAQADPEISGWLDLGTLDELSSAGYGALVDFECEASLPDAVRLLGGLGELEGFAEITSMLRNLGPTFGEDIEGLPSADELDAVTQFASALKAEPIIVGEDDSAEWRVAGKLLSQHLRVPAAEIDDYVRITAKVGKAIKRGEHRPLLALPGMSALSRDERRALQRQKPESGQEDMYLEGPARMLDILAIYR